MNAIRLLVVSTLAMVLAYANAEEETTGTDAAEAAPQVLVQKNPGCGCCEVWADHLREHGFTVEVTENPDLYDLKEQIGIPPSLQSCHTAQVDGYFIEGHVPAKDILALLRLKPQNIKGLSVAGMPRGSPGMEHPQPQSFDTIAVGTDGTTHVFANHQAGEDFSAADD
jgi:hypothetical protein